MHTKHRNLRNYSKGFSEINWGAPTPKPEKKKVKPRKVNLVIRVN